MKEQNSNMTIGMEDMPCAMGIVRLDESFSILNGNSLLYELYGEKFDSMKSIAYPQDWNHVQKSFRKSLHENRHSIEIEMRIIQASGNLKWLFMKGSFYQQTSDCMVFAVLDITEHIQKAEHLRMGAEERRLLLLHTSRFVYRFYLATRTAILTSEAASELGVPENMEDMPFVMEPFLAEDSKEEYFEFHERLMQGEKSGSAVIHWKNKAGGYLWYHFTFSMIYDRDACPQYAIISFENITEQREKELAYKKWSQFYQSQLETAVAYYESNLTKNRLEQVAGQEVLEVPHEVFDTYDEIIKFVNQNMIYTEDKEDYYEFMSREDMIRQFKNGKREISFECRRRSMEGTYYWTHIFVQLLPDPFSDDIKAFILVRNIDKEKREHLKLHELSEKDSLTGVLNRRAVIERISTLLEDKGENRERHALIMVDIDHFKDVNDHRGHQFGDMVICQIADILKNSVRPGDLVGRMGGDEFVVCLQNMPHDHVLLKKTEALCKKLSLSFGKDTQISASIGASVCQKNGENFHDLYHRSDLALYEAKRQGRNRCVFYQGGMEENLNNYKMMT